MAPIDRPKEPQSAAEYDDRTTAAVKSVLVEDTQALGDRTPEPWQRDAFGQIDALLRVLALRG